MFDFLKGGFSKEKKDQITDSENDNIQENDPEKFEQRLNDALKIKNKFFRIQRLRMLKKQYSNVQLQYWLGRNLREEGKKKTEEAQEELLQALELADLSDSNQKVFYAKSCLELSKTYHDSNRFLELAYLKIALAQNPNDDEFGIYYSAAVKKSDKRVFDTIPDLSTHHDIPNVKQEIADMGETFYKKVIPVYGPVLILISIGLWIVFHYVYGYTGGGTGLGFLAFVSTVAGWIITTIPFFKAQRIMVACAERNVIAKQSLRQSIIIIIGLIAFIIALNIGNDKTAPVVKANSVSASYGDTISVKDLASASDNNKKKPVLTIESTDAKNVQINEEKNKIKFEKPGTFSVVVRAMDGFGNVTDKAVSVKVGDTVASVVKKNLSVSGGYKAAYSLDEDADHSIFVKARDVSKITESIISVTNSDGSDAVGKYAITDDGTKLTFSSVGSYLVNVSVVDAYSNSTEAQIAIEVTDDVPPQINNVPGSFSILTTDTTANYLQNVTATDEIDGDITNNISVDDSAVKYGTDGTYEVKYTVKDAAGNAAHAKTNIIINEAPKPEPSRSSSLANSEEGGSQSQSAASVDGAVGGSTSNDALDSSENSVPAGQSDFSGLSDADRPANSSADEGETVYWTDGGESYHKTPDCPTLKRSKNIRSGPKSSCPKSDPCNICYR